MKSKNIPYKKSIFVCTNDCQGEKPSCADHQGPSIFRELRRIAKERGLHPRIRVAQAKCLGQCSQGANIMVYPDGAWYSGFQLNDIDIFADTYLSTEKND